MGLASGAIKLYLELWQQGVFKNIKSVIEMGSQEIHVSDEHFEELINAAGITDYNNGEFASLKRFNKGPAGAGLSAKAFYKLLGAQEYSSIDLNGEQGSIRHDLNLPLEDARYYNKYDLVTDLGCNEHIFNIAEAYRTMHRLCKVNGYIVIDQTVFIGNGFYRYDSSFFELLAAANNYRVLYSSYTVTLKSDKYGYQQFHIPLSRELLLTIDWAKVQTIGICYVLQKLSAADFKYPYQGVYLQESQKNAGYKLRFYPEGRGFSYVPVYLQMVRTKELLQVIRKRLPKIFKKILKFHIR